MTDLEKIAGQMSGPALLEGLAEEAAELAQAALKLARILRKENPTPVPVYKAEDSLIEELADVELYEAVVLHKLRISYGEILRGSDAKSIRWLQRLEKSCETCANSGLPPYDLPCDYCRDKSHWKEMED